MPAPAPPQLYGELAEWWPLVSPPNEYDEEAVDLLAGSAGGRPSAPPCLSWAPGAAVSLRISSIDFG